jgi:hypothetical protein
MLDKTDLENTRQGVADLATASGLRFHWRKEMHSRRFNAVNMIQRLPVLHLVVVGTPLDPSRQERGRRLCLRQLLLELEVHGVSWVVMEARTRSLNNKDMSAVNAWRSQHLISHTTRIEHADPAAEPLLWLPDIVAGATNASEAGEHRWMDELTPLVTLSRITLE